MREVAWVVFDEIHYMRDKGILKLEGFGVEIQYSRLWILQPDKVRIENKQKMKKMRIKV